MSTPLLASWLQGPRLQTLLGAAFGFGPRFLRQSGLHRELAESAPLILRELLRGVRGPALLLRLHGHARGGRPALVSQRLRLSYRELDQRVCHLAGALAARGIGPRSRVAVLLHNGHEHVELSAALLLLRATAVHVGYRLRAKEIAYILQHSGARLLVFEAALVEGVEGALAEEGVALPRSACFAVGDEAAAGFPRYEELLEERRGLPAQLFPSGADPDDQVRGGSLLYTSGTTGRSKGAHRDLGQTSLLPVVALMSELPLRTDDRHLVCCPLYHAAAPAFAAMVTAVGGCLVVPPRFEAEAVPRLIERERVTSAVMVPTMMSRLLALPEEVLAAADLRSLRWITSVAAPLPAALAERVERRLGPILFNMYGATETGLVTLARPGEHERRPGTIGRPLPSNEIRLLDEAGREVAPGAVGELYVRNGTLMSGYHNDSGATAAAQREGFISVGDLAYRDEDGYYYLADRKHDMVISAGVNIYPLEIEQRLHQHPRVQDCAVIGVPDADWGEALLALVVAEPPHGAALAQELQDFVGAELAGYKRPRQVRFVEQIPRNPTGKIDKRRLRAEAVPE